MLVVARQDLDPDSAKLATGVVLDPEDGRVVTQFALDGRGVDQDYDRSGTYLLTTYSNGRVAVEGPWFQWRSASQRRGHCGQLVVAMCNPQVCAHARQAHELSGVSW